MARLEGYSRGVACSPLPYPTKKLVPREGPCAGLGLAPNASFHRRMSELVEHRHTVESRATSGTLPASFRPYFHRLTLTAAPSLAPSPCLAHRQVSLGAAAGHLRALGTCRPTRARGGGHLRAERAGRCRTVGAAGGRPPAHVRRLAGADGRVPAEVVRVGAPCLAGEPDV